MIVVETNIHQGANKDTSYLAFIPILSGEYIGKFATSENALKDFPEVFEKIDYQIVQLEAKDFEPDFTPPASNGKGIVIPEKYQWIFPCHVGGYTIELKEKDGVKYAEESCLGWTAFVNEIRKPENRQYRSTIITVWNYGLYEAERIDL